MIKKILLYIFFGILLIIVALWFAHGGLARAKNIGSHLSNPFALLFGNNFVGTPGGFLSPVIPQGPDTYGATDYDVGASSQTTQPKSVQERLVAAEQQYRDLQTQTEEVKTFGTPSPYRGYVTIQSTNVASSPTEEYVALSAHQHIQISGWSLQSAVSGKRAFIPHAASPFILGVLNTVTSVDLSGGDSAFIVSGSSPVGVSFRENICTGYLAQAQTFTPNISAQCPTASTMLPMTADNLRQYGSDCFDYLNSLTSCTFPASMPSDLSPECRAYVSDHISYNGCVQTFRQTPGFVLPTWRIYLGSGVPLWNNRHDVIRLLDDRGRTVDVFSY